MTTTTEYRAMAEECFQWAREATTHNTRSAYLEIAKIWLTAADGRQDRPHARQPPSEADRARPGGHGHLRQGRDGPAPPLTTEFAPAMDTTGAK